MTMGPNVARVAALIGEPARALMLQALLDGRALPAGELAAVAGLSAQGASTHLAKLLDGGLLAMERGGRNRYYRLAGPHVASALETLAALMPPPPALAVPRTRAAAELRFARRCYDHLAGRLGVQLAAALERAGCLAAAEGSADWRLTERGEAWFVSIGVDLVELRRSRRLFAPRCNDWTERRPHLAGALGAALLSVLLDRGWLAPGTARRTLVLSEAGSAALSSLLGGEAVAA